MRYLISSCINGISTFDRCPFCDFTMDGHPDDVIDHMNADHSQGEWMLVKVFDAKECSKAGKPDIARLAVRIDEEAM